MLSALSFWLAGGEQRPRQEFGSSEKARKKVSLREIEEFAPHIDVWTKKSGNNFSLNRECVLRLFLAHKKNISQPVDARAFCLYN
jgi:hypothetical protein